MIYENRKSAKLFICISVTIIFLACLISSIFLYSQASADETNGRDWIIVRGKVLDKDGEGVESPKIKYFNGKDDPTFYGGDLSGGFMFTIPCTSDCSLTFYQDGYTPQIFYYTLDDLQKHLPELYVGDVYLEKYLSISGKIFDFFYHTPINNAEIFFIMSDFSESEHATTDENGVFSLSIPKNFSGVWKVVKDGYNIYISDPSSYSQDTSNVEIYIHQANKYKVSFESNGGSPINFQIIDVGKKANKPKDPILENSEFCGWYLDNNTFENPYDFSQPVNDDLTLYAKWKSAPVQISSTSPQTGDELFAIEFVLSIIAITSGLYIMQNIIKKDNQ